MAKAFKKLAAKLPPADRKRIADRRDEILGEIATLRELRRAQELTQVELAAALEVNQAAVSKLESQSDMHISTLRRLVEALGGKLKVVAEFPDRVVVIDPFRTRGPRRTKR